MFIFVGNTYHISSEGGGNEFSTWAPVSGPVVLNESLLKGKAVIVSYQTFPFLILFDSGIFLLFCLWVFLGGGCCVRPLKFG